MITMNDKVAHAIAGALVAAVASPFGWLAMVASATAAGAIKEAMDAYSVWRSRRSGMLPHHTIDPLDLLATAAGGAALAAAQVLAISIYWWLT